MTVRGPSPAAVPQGQLMSAALEELNRILKTGLDIGASDIHVRAGRPPIVRINGRLGSLSKSERYTAEQVGQLAVAILSDDRLRDKFDQASDVDLAYVVPGTGRFRVNVYQHGGQVSLVFRLIPAAPKSLKELPARGSGRQAGRREVRVSS